MALSLKSRHPHEVVATQPLPTLLSLSSCPPLHSRIAELKNHLLSDSDDDASEQKMPSKGTVLQLEERDLEAMTQHLTHERQVWLKLSLAAIRSAKSMEIASNDKLHALLHRWMEIRLLLTIETLRRDAHAYSRAHQPTATANGVPIRSILALEHFPRPAIKSTPTGLKGSKKATPRSRGTDRHVAVPATTTSAVTTSSSSLHKRPPHTAWEGTVYRHKLLTSLHYKLSLKLILQALQLHAQQAKQRRRMLTSIPTLRQQKLLQVTFLALVQYMVEARYLQHRSDVQATQFLLQRHVQTPFRLWHRRVHEQLPQWRRLQYAALTYRRYRRLQLAWKVLLVRLMRRRRMRQWQVTYRDRSRQLRAWLAWRWVWQQKDHWRSSLYARYTGTAAASSSLAGGGRGGSEAAQGQLSVQAVVARYRDRQRQWRQPAYAGIHQFPEHAMATTRSRSDSRHSRSRSRVAGDASVSLPPSRWQDDDEDNDVASRRSVFDSAKHSRFARSDSSVHLSHPSRQVVTEPRGASSRTGPPSLLRIDAYSRVTGRSHLSLSHSHSHARNQSRKRSDSGSGSGDGSDDVSDDSLVEPDASSAGFPSTLSPLTPATAKSRRATRFTFSPPGSPAARHDGGVGGGASSLPSASSSRRRASSSVVSVASSHRSRLIEDVLSRASQDVLTLLQSPPQPPPQQSSQQSMQPQLQQPQLQLSPREQQQLAALLDRIPDDDVDPLQTVTATQREAVYRLVQQRRSAWYFRQCREWFSRVLSAAHRRRCGRWLLHRHRGQHLQRRWAHWRRLWQVSQQQHALCDAVYTRRLLATVLGAWCEGFKQRYHVHRHIAELLYYKRYQRRLRRCWRTWRQLQRERDVTQRAKASIVHSLLRRVIGGWRSVIGQERYLRTAAKVVALRRFLRPMFVTWMSKCRNKRLLRRVFTVQEQCWAVRRATTAGGVNGRQAAAMMAPQVSFAQVYDHFTAWATYVRQRRRQRRDDHHARLALCFRGATLLARHFLVWRDTHRWIHRRRLWHRQWQQRRVARAWHAWRRCLDEVIRPRRAAVLVAWQRATMARWWARWRQVAVARQRRELRVGRAQQRATLRQSWRQWRLAMRARRLRRQLQLVASPSPVASPVRGRAPSSDKENASSRRNATSPRRAPTTPTPTTTTAVKPVPRGSTASSQSSSTSSAASSASWRSWCTEDDGDTDETDDGGSAAPLSIAQHLRSHRPTAKSQSTALSPSRGGRRNSSSALPPQPQSQSQPPQAQPPRIVWTTQSQFLKARRFWRIWLCTFYRVQRYRRGFAILEAYFYRKKMQDYFLQWPGRRQIVLAERMRRRAQANGNSSATRVRLVEYDPDADKAQRERAHTERQRLAQAQALEEALADPSSLASVTEYRFLLQQQREADERHRQRHPSSRNVFVARSFLQRAPPTLNELAYAFGYLQKIPDPEGLNRIKDVLHTLLYHWRRYIRQEKDLRLRSVEIRSRLRHKWLLTSLRKWIATTPRVSYRIITWLNNAAERRAFLDSQRWVEHQTSDAQLVYDTMKSLQLGTFSTADSKA